MMIAEQSLVEDAEVSAAVTHNVPGAEKRCSLPMCIMNIVPPLPGNDRPRRIEDWLHSLCLLSTLTTFRK